MKKFILPLLFVHLAMVVNAATYYFSASSGDDSRTSAQAQNSATPWKTIGKLNAIMSTLRAGDQVLFKRGEAFDGGIVVTVSGNSSASIFFGAYGSGNRPIISGFSALMNWKQVNGNIWECPFWQPTGKESMVMKNGKQQAIGRYPNRNASNGGYLVIDSHVGLTQITSSQLPSSPNWTGADIAIRKNRWVIDRSTVTSHSGTTINFISGSDNTITDKYGFFIENSPNTLDQDGEWWYDRSRTKLQMYFADNNPNAYTLRGSTVESIVTISFQNYLTFDNLTFQGGNQYGFNLTNSSYIKINSCDINLSGINAIQGLSSGNVTVSNSTINDANNNGINLYWNCSNATITNNKVNRTALIPGMSQNSTGTFQGINLRGDNNLIQYNEVDSTGANGIHFEGDYSTVQNNFVNVFGLTADDCGGIYTGQGNGTYTTYNSKSIIGNIVLNGVGAPAGTNDVAGTSYPATQGIYLDANTNHIMVSGNTVANCGQAGIFNNNTTYSNILNNTLYNNGKEQLLAVRQQNPESSVNIRGNILFAKTVSQLTMKVESYYGSNNLSGLGTVDSNYHCRPLDNNYLFYDMYLSGSTYISSYENMSTWNSKFGFDPHSKTAPALIPAFTSSNASGVNKYTNGAYNTSVSDVGSFASTGDISKVWVANRIDAGTMQVTSNTYSSNNNYMLTLPLNSSITAGKTYLLTLSLQGSNSNAPMTVYLRQTTSPQIDLTSRTMVPISITRQDIKLGFTATASATNAAIELDVAAPNGAVWVDNVNLQEATITPTNPDDYMVFAYNATSSNVQVSLDKNYKYLDATGKQYNNNTTLKPYTSVVLFKQLGTGTAKVASEQVMNVQGNLVDASSATNYANTSTSSTALSWQVDNQSSTASYYEVERSTDGTAFTKLGKASAKGSDVSATYQYSDATPAGGKNYYRVTQYDEKGTAVVSKMIMVNNISFTINPNPARDVIHLTFDQTINASDHLGKDVVIRTTSGATVKTIQLPSTNNLNRVDMNVAELKPGMYILTLTSEGKTFSKSFLKQ